MATTVLNVPDISCEHCERTITDALQPVGGVESVNVDIPARQVRVQYDPAQVSVDRMKEILEEEDYPVESVVGVSTDKACKPVNVMGMDALPSNDRLSELGVSRISYGPIPYIKAMSALQQEAKKVLS